MKHREQSPAFQEYASDLLANRSFRLMGLAERGLLWSMRVECWVNGSIPSSPVDLAALLGKPIAEVEEALTIRVREFFAPSGAELVSPDLEVYRSSQTARRERQAEGAKLTNAKRTAYRNAKPSLPRGEERSGEERSGEESSTGQAYSNDEFVKDYERNQHD